MRRASAELAERRRASLGASRGLRPDGTLDPYHAAILFRDSRGVSLKFMFILWPSVHVPRTCCGCCIPTGRIAHASKVTSICNNYYRLSWSGVVFWRNQPRFHRYIKPEPGFHPCVCN